MRQKTGGAAPTQELACCSTVQSDHCHRSLHHDALPVPVYHTAPHTSNRGGSRGDPVIIIIFNPVKQKVDTEKVDLAVHFCSTKIEPMSRAI